MPDTMFQQYLAGAFTNGPWANDEVVAFMLPLFQKVLNLHEAGLVAPFSQPAAVFIQHGVADIDEKMAHTPLSLHVNSNITAQYLPAYRCFEIESGLHDAQSDIFCLGMLLGSVAMGLNLYNEAQLARFVTYRNQPAGLNERLHPSLGALIADMTALDRSVRSSDMYEIVQRLRYYRDYDPGRTEDLSDEIVPKQTRAANKKDFILSRLRNRLFDTSRRNRLLYYKPNSRFVNLLIASVPAVKEVQHINPQLLFTWNQDIADRITGMKDLVLNKYLCFEDHPYLTPQLNQVRLIADSDEKEYGFSQLKLVIAFLHWNNLKEDTRERIQSPLLLLPVRLKRNKALKEERFTVEIADNTAIVNPVLSNYLKDIYDLDLPESIDLDETSPEAFFQLLKQKIDALQQGVGLTYVNQVDTNRYHNLALYTIQQYRKRLKQETASAVSPKLPAIELHPVEYNAYSWEFDVCNMVLGNFNYKKMSLVSDYAKVALQETEHAVFEELFSSKPKQHQAPESDLSPKHWYHVIAADPTQTKAVLYNRSGSSYVIQGPPGTGKSQTITNLIADFLAQGKNILFVCEKRAALDVVFHRLQQNNLAELCCYIHDSQGDKREFIKDLKKVYDDFLEQPMDLHTVALHRKALLERLEDQLLLLQEYHNIQTDVTPEAGMPVRDLIETVIALRQQLPEDDNGQTVPLYSQWLRFGHYIKQLSEALEHSGAEPQLALHPFSNLGNAAILSENAFSLINNLISHSLTVADQLSEVINDRRIPLQYVRSLSDIKSMLSDAVVLAPLASHGNLQLADPATPEAAKFEEVYSQYQQLQQEYQQSVALNTNWKNKFSRQETQQALEMAQKYEHSFWSFLNGNWRRLKKQLKKAYGFELHQLPPGFTTVLEQLKEEYLAGERIEAQQREIKQQYGIDNISTMYVGLEVLRRRKGDGAVLYLVQHPDAGELVLQLSKLNNVVHQLEIELKQCLFGYETKSLTQVRDELETISSNADALKELLPALKKFAALPADLQELVRNVPLTPPQAQALMADTTLQFLLSRNQAFNNTHQRSLKQAAAEISDIYSRLLQLNSDYIRAARRHDFLNNYQLSNTAASQLTQEQKLFKKEYAEGRKVLEHEMGKSKQYKSIRTLASNESGRVLKDLKPVWLMSPLSVSDSLPLDTQYFDVVIFDEASQIPLEEGVPALFRAPQAIIVGDDKQMPPSNFFNAGIEDAGDLETVEGETDDDILSVDADSLLVQGARKLPGTMLQWHYRSRYEALISFSNHAFYGAGLLTIPDQTVYYNNRPGIEVGKPEEGAHTAKFLLQNSISYHYLPNSVYEQRTNASEARYIAIMVRELLLKNTEESIGIVAFSQEQQAAILKELDILSNQDKDFDAALENASNRKDEGQFTGLFVKNLENVQGDERDIIIMSICYGHDRRNKMLMNFGPVNRKGGEKRLNVIFSRAKKHMAVVSSIKHHHITNDYNAGAGYLKKFLHYAEMVSSGNVQQAGGILNSLSAGNDHAQQVIAKPGYIQVTARLKEALESRGYMVEEAVGQSSFKCSLAVRKKQQDDTYSLGIMIDDDQHYANRNVMDQYCLRPAILENFGWKIVHVYAKDWLENSTAVLDVIIAELGDYTEPSKQQPQSTKQQQLALIDPDITSLLSQDGSRFWKISQTGNRLSVRNGKQGTKGQIQIKTFLNDTDAAQAMEQLIQDQLKAGYRFEL